jgi:hypothetical protein
MNYVDKAYFSNLGIENFPDLRLEEVECPFGLISNFGMVAFFYSPVVTYLVCNYCDILLAICKLLSSCRINLNKFYLEIL